jgi:hypothetical protein
MYPRLPLVILADGLYANQSFFRVCKDNGWKFIVTFKDGSLPGVHQEMGLLPDSAWQCREGLLSEKGKRTKQSFRWANGIGYRDFELSVVECKETITDLWKRLPAYFSENKIKRGEYEKILAELIIFLQEFDY